MEKIPIPFSYDEIKEMEEKARNLVPFKITKTVKSKNLFFECDVKGAELFGEPYTIFCNYIKNDKICRSGGGGGMSRKEFLSDVAGKINKYFGFENKPIQLSLF